MAFEIYTYTDLKKVGTGEDGWNLDSDYVLMNDIDASASQTENWNEERQVYEGWLPIGTGVVPFTGTFDGQGHKITGLYLNRTQIGQYDSGLFGSISGIVKNLGVVDADIKCYYFGGILTANSDYGTIQNCYSTGAINGNKYVGGLCGYNNYGTIQNCYSTGSATGEDIVGGFCGENYQGKIYKSYSIGAVSGDTNVGGFCGTETQGGDYDTQDNFFDYQTAGNEVEIGATKKTTSQMKDISTYTVVGNGLTEPWDIAKRKFPYKTTWRIHSWEYPKLNWEPPRSPLITFFK